MTPAQELREAARSMRDRAQAAQLRGPSPWGHESSPSSRLPVGEDVFDSGGTAVAVVRGSYLAGHITGMHPAVALAIADWLDAAAAHSDDFGGAGCGTGCGFGKGLAAARAYLGSPVEGQ